MEQFLDPGAVVTELSGGPIQIKSTSSGRFSSIGVNPGSSPFKASMLVSAEGQSGTECADGCRYCEHDKRQLY